ncbi:MAG TPA: TlyA family rRNA (cytidine-2'-O)-methyltransferase [Clostridiales bacterium]|nr:TlyA family rRNA (cytidine-2'-O)-methyltransferase [Clostridiales bacterium]
MRLDKYLAERFGSRTKAAAAISEGRVYVNGKSVAPSYEYKESELIEITEAAESYVSAGGFKLAKAIREFGFDAEGKVFADVGASTGGFTDCLLKNGAKKVYCIDVGESQLDKSLLCDKVKVIDNFNARNLTADLFDEKIDGAVIDVSFISLTYILGAVGSILSDGGSVLALIKPQFECECKNVGKNGIVKDEKVHERVISKICRFAVGCSLMPQKITAAPIVRGKNIEYVILLEKNAENYVNEKILIKSVKL